MIPGHVRRQAGINFIPAMIGLFGVSEVLRLSIALADKRGERRGAGFSDGGFDAGDGPDDDREKRAVFAGVFAMLIRRPFAALRSSVIGVVTGMIPGAGADIAAWVSYAISKKRSKEPAVYGKGSVEGVADATAANNASLAGAWVPALVFGVPGDSITAIVIGVLLMKNIAPGPDIFVAQPGLVGSIYLTFIVANLLLIPIGYVAIKGASALVSIPRPVLLPAILLFCIVGSFAINGAYFDVLVMLGMGGIGFVMERYGVPLGPVVLGIILGGPLEENLVQSLTKTDGLGWMEQLGAFFFDGTHDLVWVRPVLGIGVVMLWVWPMGMWLMKRGRTE